MNYNPNFYCPITGDVMSDPVIDRDGITYERVAIEEWIHRRATSPTTRAPMALTGQYCPTIKLNCFSHFNPMNVLKFISIYLFTHLF